MCAENTENNLQEKLASLQSFVQRSNEIEGKVQSTLQDVQEIRNEVESLLASLGDLKRSALEQVMDGQVQDVPDINDTPSEPQGGTQEQDTDASDEDVEDDQPEHDGPIKAGEFPTTHDGEWDGAAGSDDSFDEILSEEDGSRSTYQRRMVRKDPRLKDVPEEVLETIADAKELFQEAERGIQVLESLSVKSRSAQLAIWAGRARKIQDELEEWSDVLPDDFSREMHVFFGKLTTVTRENECNWIDALKRSYETDWDRYLEEQKRKLRMSLKREKRAREFLREPPKERKKDRKICRRRLRELASEEDPDEDEVKSVLIEGMDLLAMDDPAVTEVAERFRDLLEEEEQLEPLQEVVEEQSASSGRDADESDQPEVYRRPTLGPDVRDEILRTTRDQRALAIADDVTSEWKRRIEDAFQFEKLSWLDVVEENGRSVEERLDEQNVQQYDYRLLMKSRLGNDYSRVLQKSRDRRPTTIVVEEGIGVAPIRDAIEEELVKKV